MYEHDKDGEKMAIFGFYEQACPHKIPDDDCGGGGGDDDDDKMLNSMASLCFLVNYKTRVSTKKRTNENVIIVVVVVVCPLLLDITGIRVLPLNFRNSRLFTATCKNSQSASCVCVVESARL